MLNIFLSTIAFFVASFYINRYFDGEGIGKSMTRSILVFVLAALFSFGVAAIVAQLQGDNSSTLNLPQHLLQPQDKTP